MGRSSLERTGEARPSIGKGHGTEALGPSDRSDTGSDIAGGPGLAPDDAPLDLSRGSTSDVDGARGRRQTAGPDIGDENLDSDSDSTGTGERAAAGRDAPPPTDEQLSVIDDAGASDLLSSDEMADALIEEDREADDGAAPEGSDEEASAQQ